MIHKKQQDKDEEILDRRALHYQAREKKERQFNRETKEQMLQFRYGKTIDSEDEIE